MSSFLLITRLTPKEYQKTSNLLNLVRPLRNGVTRTVVALEAPKCLSLAITVNNRALNVLSLCKITLQIYSIGLWSSKRPLLREQFWSCQKEQNARSSEVWRVWGTTWLPQPSRLGTNMPWMYVGVTYRMGTSASSMRAIKQRLGESPPSRVLKGIQHPSPSRRMIAQVVPTLIIGHVMGPQILIWE